MYLVALFDMERLHNRADRRIVGLGFRTAHLAACRKRLLHIPDSCRLTQDARQHLAAARSHIQPCANDRHCHNRCNPCLAVLFPGSGRLFGCPLFFLCCTFFLCSPFCAGFLRALHFIHLIAHFQSFLSFLRTLFAHAGFVSSARRHKSRD